MSHLAISLPLQVPPMATTSAYTLSGFRNSLITSFPIRQSEFLTAPNLCPNRVSCVWLRGS
ncbi:uncharacterized protein CANTADRAFT_25217 [Suhomyces tanzawaensis NRRL Y-17324]|uniref:Uncharacterized protein n=1 Tax=Suhomyces tanzawaensis NRRL Y-17324 TaxID=984487 RepID=A0A1E4SMU6_9ASCO|nr:uncharacterized protein CANTADRAFT_25217 [Suhomyces tanzawaensis NRRL Y-17324]ODV80841.1 hypothetical protein CANTADRAFT_25217 [Suhomyces tanzawaensis NRRL Y-17324]